MVRTSGPVFDGRAPKILEEATREIEQQIGQQAEQDLRERFDSVLRHQTGRYVSRLRVTTSGGLTKVDDQRSVYGPWLEGTGSRNSTTRFKGYATFRIVGQQLERKATRVAETVLARYIGRLQ